MTFCPASDRALGMLTGKTAAHCGTFAGSPSVAQMGAAGPLQHMPQMAMPPLDGQPSMPYPVLWGMQHAQPFVQAQQAPHLHATQPEVCLVPRGDVVVGESG